jgi:hypothetical protein
MTAFIVPPFSVRPPRPWQWAYPTQDFVGLTWKPADVGLGSIKELEERVHLPPPGLHTGYGCYQGKPFHRHC